MYNFKLNARIEIKSEYQTNFVEIDLNVIICTLKNIRIFHNTFIIQVCLFRQHNIHIE